MQVEANSSSRKVGKVVTNFPALKRELRRVEEGGRRDSAIWAARVRDTLNSGETDPAAVELKEHHHIERFSSTRRGTSTNPVEAGVMRSRWDDSTPDSDHSASVQTWEPSSMMCFA
jgi:hypothetical protein